MRSCVSLLLLLWFTFPAFSQSGGGKLMALESGVTLRMESQILEGGDHKFYLVLQTNDVYECANFLLENDVKLDGDKLIVRVRGVRKADPCSTAMGPARARINLTSLSEGEYRVRTIINRQVFKSVLTVAEDYYDFAIKKEDPSLFRIYNGRLNIIPDNSIWGLCRYTSAYDKAVAEKFMSDLQAAGARKTELPPGNYGDFYLHHAGEALEKVTGDDEYEYPFVYSFSGDLALVKEVMNAYRERLQLSIKTSLGEQYRNY
ncbi:MAG: hypothetical protein AAF998_13620 [Bacteroidota bacterium]